MGGQNGEEMYENFQKALHKLKRDDWVKRLQSERRSNSKSKTLLKHRSIFGSIWKIHWKEKRKLFTRKLNQRPDAAMSCVLSSCGAQVVLIERLTNTENI